MAIEVLMPPSPRILVVDDDSNVREMLRQILEPAGYRIDMAPDGATALAHLDDDVDIMLLDIMMPGLNGLHVCRRVRARERRHHLPIIMLTALVGQEHHHAGFMAGADDYIDKPFDPHDLLDRVQVWLRASERFGNQQDAAVQHGDAGKVDAGIEAASPSIEEQVLQIEGLLHHLVAEATARPSFLAALLIPYAKAQGWDEDDLAAHLGCPRATLARLLLRPRPLSMTWSADVAVMAEAYGVSAAGLGQTLRAAETWERDSGKRAPGA